MGGDLVILVQLDGTFPTLSHKFPLTAERAV